MFTGKICPELFLISVFDLCISRGRFVGPIFRLLKVDLHMGKYGNTQTAATSMRLNKH